MNAAEIKLDLFRPKLSDSIKPPFINPKIGYIFRIHLVFCVFTSLSSHINSI